MASRYLAVSLPVQGPPASSLWNRLQDQISSHSFESPLYRLNIPNLRVGTLDSLLALSDDLLKSNSFVEAVPHKIRWQIEELEKVSGGEGTALTMAGVPVDSYLTRKGKYPTMSPLREIVDTIKGQVTRIEDDLKVPRCSKKLYEDNEYALYTVTLFRQVADNFRTSACERRFRIRDFLCSPEGQEGRKQELGKLLRDQ